MTELLTAALMRAIEQAAIASGEVTGLELMERAGRGVVEAILEWRPELAKTAHRAVVLCGPGNNGGDGFVVARLLKQRGWEVEVFLYGDEAKLPPDAAENCRRWREMGGTIDPFPVEWPLFESFEGYAYQGSDIIVDALFGTGLTRPLGGDPNSRGAFEDFLQLTRDIRHIRPAFGNGPEPTSIISIDAPSGICMDSGRQLVDDLQPVLADLTVTFHGLKHGHFLADGPEHSGVVRVTDIGLNKWSFWGGKVPNRSASLTRQSIDGLRKGSSTYYGQPQHTHHKYFFGHALILSGGVGEGGAARLAARGALRIGAGLVTVGAPPAAIIENAAQLNAIMLRPVADADALAEILKDKRLNALCLGPGLGVGAHTLGLVAAALAAKRGTVLDADALTSFAEDPSKLFALLHGGCVLTPHMGEFGRLFPDIAGKLAEPAIRGPAYSKVDAAREAAARAGCVVLLKGPDTVIAGADGRAAINSAHYERAAPWLATAGSGDVLAGMVTGLLARGFMPMAAAETAAWLHVEAARKFGPGLIAEDIPEQLPAVFRDLGL